MTIEVIDRLYETGDLRKLIHSGILSPNVLTYRKVFHLYNERRQLGRKKMDALEDVSFTFGYGYTQIYTILKLMGHEPKKSKDSTQEETLTDN